LPRTELRERGQLGGLEGVSRAHARLVADANAVLRVVDPFFREHKVY
jgi:hypothetical protein